MKIKELNLSANIAWSPENVTPIYLACGTSSLQLDTSDGSSSQITLYDLSPGKPSLDMTPASSKTVPSKFNKLIWNGNSLSSSSETYGLIVGGCENGSVYIYSAEKLLNNESPLVISMEGKHTGPVFSLDFNNHQTNLLATGSSDCEIIIWDINEPSSPMTPGPKPNIVADVTGLAWNRQVEHIMASTYAGRCVVYDLRKSTSIIQISESVSGIKAHDIKWHPNAATQLILSSDDDNVPIAQVWDLRFATAPLKSIEGHQRGIMSTAWCSADPNLFITSGKDNKIYVWNPNNADKVAEFVGEFPSYNQWSFDVAWCVRDPSLVATSSVDGTVSVYSILGGGISPAQTNKFSAIADSFPGMEVPTEAPLLVQPQSIQLKYPPKWFARRSGVSFAFGGRLLSWNANNRIVSISQVITEPELVARSCQLEETLSQANLSSYCQNKSDAAVLSQEKMLWNFIGATFEPSFKSTYMSLLGFTPDQIATKVRPASLVNLQDLTDKISNLVTNGQDESSGSSLDPSEQFEMIASAQSFDKTPENEVIEPEFESLTPLPNELLSLSIGEDPHGMVRHALLIGDYESAVILCFKLKKTSLALIIAAHAGSDLFTKTRDKVLKYESHSGLSPLVSCVVHSDLFSIVSNCDLSDWKEALIAILTYSSEEEFSSLADCLGERLEMDGQKDSLYSAVLCFLCSGNLERFISCWTRTKPATDKSPSNLQDLAEIIMVVQRALSSVGYSVSLKEGSESSIHLCHYASLLSSQGALSTAVSYLNNATEGEMVALRDRLYRSLGYQTGNSIASRKRSTSSSSQPSLRRTSTPFSQQNAFPLCASVASVAKLPSQFTPSVQAQQSTYVTSQQPTYYNFSAPPLPKSQMHPAPSFRESALVGTQNTMNQTGTFMQPPQQPPLQPPQQPPQQPPPAPPVSGPPILLGGLRKNVISNRYVPEPAKVSNNSMTQPGMFTPTPLNLLQPIPSAQYNTHSEAALSNQSFPPSIPFMPEQQQQESNFSAHTPAAYDSSVPRGWNDPPPLSSSRKGEHSGAKRLQNLKQAKHQKGHQSNIDPSPIAMMNPASNVMTPDPQQFTGFQNYQDYHNPGSEEIRGQNQLQSPISSIPVRAEPNIQKEPLPQEYLAIQDTFNRLREKGIQVTSNPTAKQRLEDVAVKLEILYDKLRAGQIGASTTAGLHQIVSAIQAGDYHRALQLHASTITTGSFSEMSQFMPAIKMLLTTCMQCQVFIH